MRRVSASPVAIGALSVVTLGCWWLANLALLRSAGFDAAPMLASGAAAYALLAQAACVVLVVTHWSLKGSGASATARLLPVLVTMAPFWPLYALLWQTSRIPAAEFFIAQFFVVLVAVAAFALVAIAKRIPGLGTVQSLVPGVLSLILLAGTWSLRDVLTGGFA